MDSFSIHKPSIIIKPLITIQNPRTHHTQVLDNYHRITKYDVLWISNHPLDEAFNISKQFFLSKSKYTHLVRLSDDTVITPEQIDILINDLERRPDLNIEALSAVGNVDMSVKGQQHYGLCMYDLPSADKNERVYNWLPIKHAPKSGLCSVLFSGAYCMIYSRRLIEQDVISLSTDLVAPITRKANPEYLDLPGLTCCVDLVTSHELYDAGIREWVDFGVVTKHLKVPAGHHQQLRVGNLKTYTDFIPASQPVDTTR